MSERARYEIDLQRIRLREKKRRIRVWQGRALVLLAVWVLCSLLFGVSVVQGDSMRPAYHEGDVVIFLRLLPGGPTYGDAVILEDPDGREIIKAGKLLFAAGMIHRYEGGGFCFCPEADGTDDLLDVMVVSNLAKWKVSYLLPMALFGRHTGFPEVHMERCSSLSFQTDRAEPVHLDGESGGHRTEERIGLETERLRLLGDWVKEGMER